MSRIDGILMFGRLDFQLEIFNPMGTRDVSDLCHLVAKPDCLDWNPKTF